MSQWGEIIDRVSPTVSKQLLRFGGMTVLNAITPDWLRFDRTMEPLADIGRPIGSPRILLFDRAEVSHRLGPLSPELPASPERLQSLVENFFRVLGLLTVVVHRGEFLVGIEGAALLRRYLIDLMLVQNNRAQYGVLRLNPLLSSDQRSSLEQLPAAVATREGVIEAHLACARAFRPLAHHVLNVHGLDYPQHLDRATLFRVAQLPSQDPESSAPYTAPL